MSCSANSYTTTVQNCVKQKRMDNYAFLSRFLDASSHGGTPWTGQRRDFWMLVDESNGTVSCMRQCVARSWGTNNYFHHFRLLAMAVWPPAFQYLWLVIKRLYNTTWTKPITVLCGQCKRETVYTSTAWGATANKSSIQIKEISTEIDYRIFLINLVGGGGSSSITTYYLTNPAWHARQVSPHLSNAATVCVNIKQANGCFFRDSRQALFRQPGWTAGREAETFAFLAS